MGTYLFYPPSMGISCKSIYIFYAPVANEFIEDNAGRRADCLILKVGYTYDGRRSDGLLSLN